jgi:hypothetical protein
MDARLFRVAGCLALLACGFSLLSYPVAAQQVFINEVMSSNGTVATDEDGDFEDWIELFNAGGEAVQLGGYGLSDRIDEPFQWILPDTVLGAGQFVVVWASGKDRRLDGVLHANFRLSVAGEDVILTAPDSSTVDHLAPIAIPRDVSYGRAPDGTSRWQFFVTPTPGAPNADTGLDGFLDPPVASHEPGMYTTAFGLALSTSQPGAAIRFTLDGSVPNEQSPVYAGPILIQNRSHRPETISLIRTAPGWNSPVPGIFKGTVVRARAFADGQASSDVATFTYLVASNIQGRFPMPIVSIAVNEHDFFDYVHGIYVPGKIYDDDPNNPGRPDWLRTANYTQRGPEWERPIHIEFFEPDGHRAFSINAGARIHGGATRSAPMKSLRLYFRSEFDEENYLRYPIFTTQDRNRFKRLILRNSGNDFGFTMFRDAMMHRLVGQMGFDTEDYRPAIVLVNGEFWGLHNVRERFDDHYIENVYGVARNDLELLESVGLPVYGSERQYFEVLQAIDARSPIAHIETLLDVDNYIHYQLSQIFFDNRDWPGNNIKFWRRATAFDPLAPYGHDGRWRWLMYDVDFGFGLYDSAVNFERVRFNTLRHATGDIPHEWSNPPGATRLFRGLLQNEDFRRRFITAFADHLNTTFSTSRVTRLIDEMQEVIRPVMQEHINRWRRPSDLNAWNAQVELMRRFARERPTSQRLHIVDHFPEVSGMAALTVDVSDARHGQLKVNSITIDGNTVGLTDPAEPYPWSGTYFRGVPVRVVALPTPGYRLAAWEGIDVEPSDTLTLMLQVPMTIRAVFERDGHRLAEAAYRLNGWDPGEPAGTYPPHMTFRQSRTIDPGIEEPMEDLYVMPYDMEQRTRVVGLGAGGVAFINTGTSQGVLEGYQGRDLGAAVLDLSTTGCLETAVTWTGSTVRRNEREYAIGLQYRVGDAGAFADVLDKAGEAVAYVRGPVDGHAEKSGPIRLDPSVNDVPLMQLRWVYHHTGRGTSGPRDMLAIRDIHVVCATAVSIEEPAGLSLPAVELGYNFPNPFTASTTFEIDVRVPSTLELAIYDVLGRRITTLVDEHTGSGRHRIEWHAEEVPAGVYFARLRTPSGTQTRRMILVR